MSIIAKNLLLIYFLLGPFYLFKSGTIQPADIFLILSAMFLFIGSRLNPKTYVNIKNVIRDNKLLLLFIVCTFIINGLYFSLSGEYKFVLSSVYYVFNFVGIIIFTIFAKDKIFLSRMSKVLKINLVLQLVFYVSGLGREYSADRYMGTFNDPNQFGFYIFISLLFLFIIEIVLKRNKRNLIYWLLGAFLIVQSASTGMLLGLTTFITLLLIYNVMNFKFSYSKLRRNIIRIISVIIIIFISFIIYTYVKNTSINQTRYDSQSVPAVNRVASKFNKTDGQSDISIWEDRGYDIIYKYPQYLLFGAGEGDYSRYSNATNNYGIEIHATLPSILFYYGVIPFILLIRWLYSKFKYVDTRVKIALVALLIESFTLINQRQPLFWMIILLASMAVSAQLTRIGTSNNKETLV